MLSLDVALVPGEARAWRETVCIVVDAVRASASIVTILDRGARAVVPVGAVGAARRLARDLGAVLAGELEALTPLGFDYGNSPAELARADLADRLVVLRTANGTAVLRRLGGVGTVIVGCLPNATACSRAALVLARQGSGRIGIVCAGRDGGFVLDDALVAGVLVSTIGTLADDDGVGVQPSDAARAVERMATSDAAIASGFRESASGRRLIELGLEDDLACCLRRDVSRSVPVLVASAPRPRLERLVWEEQVNRGRSAPVGVPGVGPST